MRQQMEAERRRRAQVAQAIGEAEAQVRMAEAHKRADVLRAEGRAEALRLQTDAEGAYLQRLSQLVGAENAARILVAQKTLEGFDRITASPANKVFLPNSMAGVLALPESTGDPARPEGGSPRPVSSGGAR
jgi:regulator of protease activity HflC (stomatin/prohibitin superfamily)